MKTTTLKPHAIDRRGERGAALVMTLLMSTLLLAAGASLVMSTMMSATGAVDSTPEQQAYYAAESGLQAALNALRGNLTADPVLSDDRTLTFRTAITLEDSNDTDGGDDATFARLSRYLPYEDLGDPESRVTIVAGVGYKVRVEEPAGIATPAGEEPNLLLVTSTGFGPRGARKQLQLLVRRSMFDIDPPAALTLAGGDDITLDLGNSNNVTVTGTGSKPAIAVSPVNAAEAQGVMNDAKTPPTPATVGQLGAGTPQPSFLASPDAARLFLAELKVFAGDEGRYFASQAAVTGGMGTEGNPKVTFIDNYGGAAVSLGAGMAGTGLLIVTGKLETHGNTNFNGVILALGTGEIERKGGGHGVVSGGLIVACFDPTDEDDDTFCNPSYHMNGGGNSTTVYDADAVAEALRSTGRRVLGIVEN